MLHLSSRKLKNNFINWIRFICNRYLICLRISYTYVYWTVHHLDSWVKRNQLDATYFIILFNAQHVSDVNTSIFRRLRLIRSYFMGCIWFGVCWRSISVWLWWCGIRMLAEALQVELQPAYGYHTTIATLKRNANTHRTRYNPWNNYELVAGSWRWTY